MTAALAAACVQSGRSVAVLKAAQTGPDDDAAWIAARVPGIVVRTALRYEAAVAPAVAARLEGAPEPSLEPIVAAARELRAERRAPSSSRARAGCSSRSTSARRSPTSRSRSSCRC